MGLHQLSRLAAALAVFSLLPGCGCNKAPPATPTLKDEGQDCKRDDECKTGLCDSVPGFATVCVRGCEQGCTATEVCTQLQPARFACQPDRGGLCKRCELDTDCPYPADKCIVVNNEKVCGRDCAFDGTCPGSYRCLSGLGADGLNKPQQCTPQSGTCACTATTSGQSISCQVENGFGRCTGERVCEGTTGYGACTARTPVKESCNGVDDDCNGTVDDSLPTVTCGVGACLRTASSCVAGQPGACLPGDAGVEACNGLDDDCDGTVDNGFATATDVNNCGACGRVCALANATPRCAASVCDVATCNAGFGNCDGLAPNGCESTFATDPLHCGRCNNACSFAGATPRCEAGDCKFTCLPDFYDLNNNPVDGCEYGCRFSSATDLPDLGFVDANCDGIDGELNNGIFVAPAPIGNDANPGTKAQPKATPAAGIAAAKATNKRDVYLAAGTYTGTLDVSAFQNKYIAGGYAPGDFRRSLVNTTTVSNGNPAVQVDGSGGTTLQFITFQGASAASADALVDNGDGQSAYGALVKDSLLVKFEGLSITAGAGSAGLAGTAGADGLNGSNGGNGSAGCLNDTLAIVCETCSQPARGLAGPSPSQCGRPGGAGGLPTDRPNTSGSIGISGVIATSGGLGAPGSQGNWTPPAQYNGLPGSAGAAGTDGLGAAAVGLLGPSEARRRSRWATS